ncbi:cyclic nucleotide-gated ion channel subunit B [Arctopsyche grandis]|uniref:cyclic nucleotide-gated ion channel subunit B n=1 Tax=Arctopsyche grandis TaxID=121162 RepID=UPI00406D6CAB
MILVNKVPLSQKLHIMREQGPSDNVDAWTEDTPSSQTPKSFIRKWLRLRESTSSEPIAVFNSCKVEPYLVTPACNPIRACSGDEDDDKIEESTDENNREMVGSFLQRITGRFSISKQSKDRSANQDNQNEQQFPAEESEMQFPISCCGRKYTFKEILNFANCRSVIDPHGVMHFMWLFTVSLCYIYNLIVVPLRASFPYQTPENTPIWLVFDAVCDVIYLIDVVMMKPRVSFITDGCWIKDPQITKENYHRSFLFKMDVISLLPLEILYLYFGTSAVVLRLPRMCKAQTFSQFFNSLDKMLSSPLIIRVARTLIYTFYLIHLNACSYYMMSSFEGIGYNGWVYNGEGNAYVRCFYFATKTSTSIGKNPKPENKLEYVYMTFAWLMGVCVFALLVGQIRYIIITATKSQTEYRKLLAETMKCMRELNIPIDLQNRVTSWFDFTWKQHGTLDDSRALDDLPVNLKTELAISMHIQTLSKVKLFTDCEQAVLRDLVLKLRSVIFLPGDIICRKGDVGREMYILKRGEVEVMSGSDNSEVIATLQEGSVFGEISLLNINGINRRTADVRSRSFTNIFVLNKFDFNSVLDYYPEAQQLLLKRANDLMDINAARDKANQESEIISSPSSPPESEVSTEQHYNEINATYSVSSQEEIIPCTELENINDDILYGCEDLKSYFEKIERRAMPKNFGRGKFPNHNRFIDVKTVKPYRPEVEEKLLGFRPIQLHEKED